MGNFPFKESTYFFIFSSLLLCRRFKNLVIIEPLRVISSHFCSFSNRGYDMNLIIFHSRQNCIWQCICHSCSISHLVSTCPKLKLKFFSKLRRTSTSHIVDTNVSPITGWSDIFILSHLFIVSYGKSLRFFSSSLLVSYITQHYDTCTSVCQFLSFYTDSRVLCLSLPFLKFKLNISPRV